MSNVVMGFNYSKNQIIELLYANANREISHKDVDRILARLEIKDSRHQANVCFWYELIELEVTRMFNCEDEKYQRATAYTRYFTMSFPQAAENVEWAVNTRWMQNLENN
jgi:hypothetical protein